MIANPSATLTVIRDDTSECFCCALLPHKTRSPFTDALTMATVASKHQIYVFGLVNIAHRTRWNELSSICYLCMRVVANCSQMRDVEAKAKADREEDAEQGRLTMARLKKHVRQPARF